MTKDEVIRMAREAGGRQVGMYFDMDVFMIERFAALVAAPLEERIQDLYRQIESLEKQLDDQYKLGMEAEREACAKVCLETEPFYGQMFAAAIRARGEHD